MDDLMIPPSSLEAEQAVIGAVMLDAGLWDDVSFLLPTDFYHHNNRVIWEQMRVSESRDFVSMASILSAEHRILLSDIARSCPVSKHAEMYARIVKDRSLLREIIKQCNETAAAAFDTASSPTNITEDHIRRLDSTVNGVATDTGLRHVFEITKDWYHNTMDRGNGCRTQGASTGFKFLDQRWGGLRDSTVTVIAGRPKTGKTTLAINIAEYVSRTMPVAIFQMEMGEDEMADRLVAAIGRVELDKIREGNVGDNTDSIIEACNVLRESRLFIDAKARQSIDYIRSSAKRFAKQHGKPAIFIDYLGLIDVGNTRGTRNEAVGELSREVKLLAKELNCPIVLLCQMNRNAEREKRRPQLSDLRDSGSIEQDADVICFTHKDDDEQEYSEIITRAIRSGRPGTDYLLCNFGVGRFETPDIGWEPPTKTAAKKKSKGDW